MRILRINRYSTWLGNMGRNWQFYGELYYVPSRPCGLGSPCPCGGMEQDFKAEECIKCPIEPINTLAFRDIQDDDNSFYEHDVLLYNRREVLANCPIGMVPAEVIVEEYEDGQYVKVDTFFNL